MRELSTVFDTRKESQASSYFSVRSPLYDKDISSMEMKAIWYFLFAIIGSCHANGIPQHLGMGVIYAVPAMMGATILLSLIVVMGMACNKWSENRKREREEKAKSKQGKLNSGLNIQEVEMTTGTLGNYAEISEVSERL